MILKGSFLSNSLSMETGLTVILPDNPKGAQPSKVVYLLHGLLGSSGDWLNYTMLPVYAAEHGVAVIMPEVARSFYADMKYGLNYFTYIVDELPKVVRSAFNLSPTRESTAIIGGSMGGYGAMKACLARPENYKYCCAFSSPCLFLKEFLSHKRTPAEIEELKHSYGRQLITDFEAIFGENLEWRADCDLLHLAANMDKSAFMPKLYLSCGTEDYYHSDNLRFAEKIQSLGFDTTFEARHGSHDWYFFDSALRRSLDFCFSGK